MFPPYDLQDSTGSPSYTTYVGRNVTYVLGFFRQANLAFRVRPQRLFQVVFDFFDQGRWFQDLDERAEA